MRKTLLRPRYTSQFFFCAALYLCFIVFFVQMNDEGVKTQTEYKKNALGQKVRVTSTIRVIEEVFIYKRLLFLSFSILYC